MVRAVAAAVLVALLVGTVATAMAAPRPSPTPQPPANTTTTPSPTSSAGSSTPRPTQPPDQTNPPQNPGGGCAGFDVPCQMQQAMTGWLRMLVERALVPVFGLLGDSLLTTPRVDQTRPVEALWASALVLANTLLVLLVIVAGYTLLTNPTVHATYTAKEIVPRLVVGVVLVNVSLLLIGRAIELANGLSAALLGPDIAVDTATDRLRQVVTDAVAGDDAMVLVWVATLAVMMLAGLGLVYLVRMTVTVALIAVAPLALLCHCLPQTDPVARLWWRTFVGVLTVQVAQALVVVAAVRVFLHTGWFTDLLFPGGARIADLWIVICLLYVLLRIPAWVTRWIWRSTRPTYSRRLTAAWPAPWPPRDGVRARASVLTRTARGGRR